MEVSAQVTVSATHKGYIGWYLDDTLHVDQEIAGAVTASWEGPEESPQYIENLEIIPFAGYKLPDMPAYKSGYIKAHKDSGATFEIYALHIRFIMDESYTSPDSDHRRAEVTDRTTAANRLYTPNRSCSAWHIQRVLAHTTNKIMHEAVWGITLPVFSS
jgi:hypothetical protein